MYDTVTPSISNSLPAGMLLLPGFTDDPTIPDLIFTYNGPDFRTSGAPYAPLATFAGRTANSIYANSRPAPLAR